MALTLAGAVEDVLTKAQEATGIRSLVTGAGGHKTSPVLVARPWSGVVDFDAFCERTIKHTVRLEIHIPSQDERRALATAMPYVDTLLAEFAQDEVVGDSGWKVESISYEIMDIGYLQIATLGPVLNITVYGTEDC